jgi:ankyrin repeat protein
MLMLIAASDAFDYKVLGMLLISKASVNIQDNMGRTALYFACRAGSFEKVSLLLQVEGIDKNIRTKGGDTPLMAAI